MGVFFPNIDLPDACQLCRFAPIVYTPDENGKITKEQICLINKELVQVAIVDSESEFPDSWWEDKHLVCQGMNAVLSDNNSENERNNNGLA